MKNKVLFSLICFLIVLFFGGVEFLAITAYFDNYQQTDTDRIEFIQKNVDNNYKEILGVYNDIGSLEYVNEIDLSFDECNYEVTKGYINVWKNSEKQYLIITYGISDGKLYLKDIHNNVLQQKIINIFLLCLIAFVGIYLIYLNYKKFIKNVE